MTTSEPHHAGETARLGLWDAVSIIIGIVVGTTIFKSPQFICLNVSSSAEALAAWLLGGVLALIGGLCYAELTTAYPRSGGDYVYLTRSYGRFVGFLFGWAQLAVIITASVGAMAFVFADYAARVFQLRLAAEGATEKSTTTLLLAAAAVVALTVVNLLGVVLGKSTQNVLSFVKIGGLVGIAAAGIAYGHGEFGAAATGGGNPDFALALVLVLYAYGGWNDAAFVAAEVRDRRRDLPRALLFGLAGITLIYLLVNVAYLSVLGFEGVRRSGTPAADVLAKAFGPHGGTAMSVLVMLSALGAINGLLFTGSRVYATLGRDHALFAVLGRWHPTRGTPTWSLIAQAVVTLLFLAAVGAPAGHAAVDAMAQAITGAPVDWSRFSDGFDMLVVASAPAFWMFFLLSGLSLFVLRAKDREIERPFKVPGYPIVPMVFCLTSAYMLWSSANYARGLALLGLVPVALGVPLYFISESRRTAQLN